MSEFFCQSGGIDIITQKDHLLSFVEVKYCKNNRMGGAFASVSPAKRRHLIRSAKVSLQRHLLLNKLECRFDVMAITGSNGPHTQVQIQ